MIKVLSVHTTWRGAPGAVPRVAAVLGKLAHDLEAHAKMGAPVDTGFLKGSIQARQTGALAWEVTVAAEYGAYVEYGTRRMAAQPYFTPAFARIAQVFEPAIAAAMGGAV